MFLDTFLTCIVWAATLHISKKLNVQLSASLGIEKISPSLRKDCTPWIINQILSNYLITLLSSVSPTSQQTSWYRLIWWSSSSSWPSYHDYHHHYHHQDDVNDSLKITGWASIFTASSLSSIFEDFHTVKKISSLQQQKIPHCKKRFPHCKTENWFWREKEQGDSCRMDKITVT